jgi:hypothetical protein
LLLGELPDDDDPDRLYRTGRLAAACAKGGRDRQWWCARRSLAEVWSYVEGQRAEVVQRARQAGRYDDLPAEVRIEPLPTSAFGLVSTCAA